MKTADQGAVSPAPGPDAESSRDVFVARQPIFDRRRRVYGYELLFRASLADLCPPTDGTEATRHVMEVAWLSLGMKTLVGNKRVFVNFTRDLLLAGFEAALPPKRTVVEILESVDADHDVVRACKRLKQNGYRLALDDFIYRPALDPLIEMADLIKISFGECDPQEQCRHVRRVVPNAALLAEKVETQEDYAQAAALGFSYFQGWFFCRPETLTGRALTGSHMMYLKLIQAVRASDVDVNELEKVIRADVSLTHRFLKFLGSATFGWPGPFSSVRHGLALLGTELTRRWVSLISLGEMAKEKPQELLINVAVRARVCEALAPRAGLAGRESDLFFLGLLSLVDSMLDRPMRDVLADLPLAEDLEAALLGGQNALRPLLDLVVAYERGEWGVCATLCAQLGVTDATIAQLYRDGVSWANEMFAS